MIRAVRRRFTVYRIYRQNRALWDAYLFALGTSADPLSTEVLEALDSFLLEFISSYDRLSQPKLLHRFFGESFLPAVVDALIQLIAEHGTVLVNEGCDGLKLSRSRSVIERTLIVCSIILQDPVYSSQVAFNLPLTTQILSLLESIEDKELKTLVLQLISGICSNHESRLEIARLEGFRKILDLLNHGDESLSHQILRTLRIFLDAESDNQNIFSDRRPSLEIRTRAASPNSFLVSASNANTSSSAEKAGTWSRLRSSQPEKPPQIVRSKSLINLGITHFVSFPSEFGIFSLQNNTADDEEPANDERQELFEHRDSVIPINRNVVSKQKQQFSELNNSALSVSTTSIVKTLLTTQGALEQLSRSLQESHLEMQLELLQTISTLIMRNNASQREFARIKGYSSVTRLLLQAVHDLPESKCHDFLAECFGIISTIILDGDPQNLISNLSAFSWLMTEISPAGLLAHSPVMAYVADFLNELLIGNPLNSAAFVEHIQNLVCSYSSSHVSARRRVMNLLLNLDILLCLYTNAVLDGLIQLWASPFDCDLFDCTLKLLQNRNLHQAPRSSETMQLITSIGKHLSDGSVSVSDRNSLIHLLIIAAISGESYSSSPNSDPEFSSSCVDLEEAMDILYMTVISRWPEKELALYFLGYLSSIWSCWSALNLSRLGHHADTQLNNCGLRLLFRLLEIPNVDAKYVMIVISSFLLGLFGDEDISRFQREFAFTGGFQVFINYLLLHKENFDMLASGVFALMAAILNNPTNKLTLECEPKLDQLLNVLILHEEFASTKYNFFAFVFELATECENDSKQEFLNIPKAMRPSDNAMQAIFAISQWRESSLLSQRPKPSISLSKEYDDSLFWQKRACKPPANSGEGSEDYPVMQSTETRLFRVGSVIPLQCIKICVSVKSPEAQAAMLLSILQAIKGQPHNKLILTEIDALSFLLRSWKNFMLYSLDVRDSFFSLISCLGRYSIQPNQVRLLFDLAYCAMSSSDGNTESYILDMIAAIAARITPETYFSFKNPTSTSAPFVSSTFTRTPVSRTGYSVVFWFRISRYCNEETSLFTWVQNDAPMYEVLLRLTPRPCGDNDRSVCIRCLNLGTFMFDKQETITEHEWHHFVLTHTRSGVAITIDSVMIGKYPAIPYPSTIIKRDSFHLIIGGSNLVGQIGSVSVIEGCLDHSQVQLYFDQGPSPSLFSDAKLLLKVQAEDFVEPGYRNSISSPVALASRALSGSSILSSDNRVSLPSNVVPHHTMSLRTAFSSPGVGGFSLCIPFIGENRSESNGARLTALRILSELISQSAGGMAEFERQRGFEMLCYCLTPCHLSMEVFNVLLDITRKHSSCFAIIMELLRHSTGPGTRSKVLGILADMVRDESLLCITGSGLMGLLELLSISAQIDEPAVPTDLTTPSPSLLSSVLSIIEHVLMTSNIVNDFEIIIAFIACKHEHCELLSEERAAMISLFCCCSEKRESLLSSISFPLVIKMLESTSTNARVQCLRLLALLFRNSPKNKSHFVKIHGFDAVLRLLAKHQPVNEKICDAIFDLALDRYNAPSKVSGGPSSSLDDRPNAIVHPEAIRLLLELLRLASSRPTLHLRYIERLDELIESRPNLSILLAEPWLHWCRQYLEGIGRFQSVERLPSHLCQQEPQYVNDTDSVSTSSVLSSTRGENGERHRARLVSRFVRLIQKIAIRDLSWHTGRSSCLPALLLMVEASEFVSLVVDRILHHFEKRPRLDESEAYCLIRNLSRIIESIDELCGAGEKPISGKWSVRLIHLINLLASQNNGDIRLRMKQSGLFELRDQLLLRFCRQPCSPSDRFVALSQLSLDAVASDTKFRSSDGILYLFRWFVCDEDHAQLRSLLVDVLRNRLGQHLEARKDLERAVGDPDILHRLLESSMSDSEFIIWFFAEEQNAQRQMLLSRLEKSLQISEIYARKQLEKIEERRQKRIRSRLDSLGKAAAASERDVQDFLEKCEITVSRFSKLIATQTELAADARLARLELGASVYANQCRNFNGNLGCNYEDSPSSSRFCYICSIEFESEWNAICHLRLDHWLCDVQAKSTRSVRDGCVSPLQS